jgi:Putative beta-barrel porin-2, OmpL-like. bbp2
MFARLIALLMSLPLSLTLSAAADAQTPVAMPASSKAAGPDTENATTDEKRKDSFMRVHGLLIPLKAAAKTEEKKNDQQPMTEREKILLDRMEADREAKIFKVDKMDRVGDLDNAQSKKTGQSNKTNKGTAPASAGKAPDRRAKPAPLDGIFPSSEYIGPTPLIGVPDTDPVYPMTEALWRLSPALKESRIKVYGWVNPGISVSTSDESNIPESYAIVPNIPQLDQGILRFERLPDTVQTDHVDWGFRFTNLYGIDYRWTTSQGWFSGQLLKHNRLYGWDPLETYGLIYVPKVAKGMVIKFGRYISPPDIEAQLAPDNYLFTHSLMFTYDSFTQTGVNAAVKLNDSWTILGGIHAGSDVAPWNEAAHPTGLFLVRWVSKSNNDSIFGGINSANNGRFKGFHDNLQQSNITWTHRFNEKGTFVTATEAYYIWQNRALVGGTVNFGPPRSWFRLTGPGAPIQGNAPAIGVVNYTAIKISKRNFITLRPIDYLVDVKGERTGFATTLSSWTVGLTHRFGERIMIRPELRYEHAFSAKPWDNGRRNNQFMFAMDAIIRF